MLWLLRLLLLLVIGGRRVRFREGHLHVPAMVVKSRINCDVGTPQVDNRSTLYMVQIFPQGKCI